jgi:hypothetical protein
LILILQIIVGVAVGVVVGGLLLRIILVGDFYLKQWIEFLLAGIFGIFVLIPFCLFIFFLTLFKGWDLCMTAAIGYAASTAFFGWGAFINSGINSTTDVPLSISATFLMLLSGLITFALFGGYCSNLMVPFIWFLDLAEGLLG